jgi:hypothetical protein
MYRILTWVVWVLTLFNTLELELTWRLDVVSLARVHACVIVLFYPLLPRPCITLHKQHNQCSRITISVKQHNQWRLWTWLLCWLVYIEFLSTENSIFLLVHVLRMAINKYWIVLNRIELNCRITISTKQQHQWRLYLCSSITVFVKQHDQYSRFTISVKQQNQWRLWTSLVCCLVYIEFLPKENSIF